MAFWSPPAAALEDCACERKGFLGGVMQQKKRSKQAPPHLLERLAVLLGDSVNALPKGHLNVPFQRELERIIQKSGKSFLDAAESPQKKKEVCNTAKISPQHKFP